MGLLTPSEFAARMQDPHFREETSKWTPPRYEWRFQDRNDPNIVWDYHPEKPKWTVLIERQSDGIMRRVIWDPTKRPPEPRTIMVKQADGTWNTEFNPLYPSNFQEPLRSYECSIS